MTDADREHIAKQRTAQERIEALRESIRIYIEDIYDARWVQKHYPNYSDEDYAIEKLTAGLARCRAKLAALEAEQRRA